MGRYPVRLRASLDPVPGRWLWLVKWLLLIPHYVLLALLWIGAVVTTLVAYVAVLLTGRYPAGLYDFNVGVLRWTWRVGYYGYQVLGTDRYPPFTLADRPDYPAGLAVDPPLPMARWRPLVAWLLATPHVLIVAALTGGWRLYEGDVVGVRVTGGLVAVVGLVVGAALLFTGGYPLGLYHLLVGVARWTLRTVAYIVLLTPVYPPLELDQRAVEPAGPPPVPGGTEMAGDGASRLAALS
jgi:hypothetical protein